MKNYVSSKVVQETVALNQFPTATDDLDVKDLTADSFQLRTSVMEDLRFPVNVIKIPSVSKIPERLDYGLAFDKATEEECYVVVQLPHSRDTNTDLKAHFHWQTSDNNAGDVVWGLSYSVANIGSSFSSFVPLTTTDSSELDATKHLMTSQITIPATTLTKSAMLKIKLFRDATNDDDNYNADAILLEFDIHYYTNKLGENI